MTLKIPSLLYYFIYVNNVVNLFVTGYRRFRDSCVVVTLQKFFGAINNPQYRHLLYYSKFLGQLLMGGKFFLFAFLKHFFIKNINQQKKLLHSVRFESKF